MKGGEGKRKAKKPRKDVRVRLRIGKYISREGSGEAGDYITADRHDSNTE